MKYDDIKRKLKIKELIYEKRCRLAWILDKKTMIGFITSINIAKCNGKWGEELLYDVLKYSKCSESEIKKYFYDVIDYILPENLKVINSKKGEIIVDR